MRKINRVIVFMIFRIPRPPFLCGGFVSFGENMTVLFVFFVISTFGIGGAVAECADGYTSYLGPDSGYARDANGVCSPLCDSGISALNVFGGHKFNLFASKNTAHAIHVKYGNDICYLDVVDGHGTGTLNIKSADGGVYHVNIDALGACPVMYSLSYSCGDGVSGTAPVAREIAYGDLYSAPYNAGTCYKPGYYLSGWQLGDTVLEKGEFYEYAYTVDNVMVAQWRPNNYGAAVFCNYCNTGTYHTTEDYVISTFLGKFVAPASVNCINPSGRTLVDYQVLDLTGTATGKVLTPGSTTQWLWPKNMILKARWSESGTVNPKAYTLSFSCGSGASGTPPASQSILAGAVFTSPVDAGTCKKDGYSLTGWKIDSSGLEEGQYYEYTYNANKTMVAQWVANVYGAPYLCNNGSVVETYLTGTYGTSVTPSKTACTAPSGKTLSGYQILNTKGNSTGTTVSAGSSFVWNWAQNLQLKAVWK